ncbi:MAG: DUF4271 domain-containing protein [Moheibacter sp.]
MKFMISTVFYVERPIESTDWVIYLLLITLALIGIGRLLFSGNFESINNLERFLEINDNQRVLSFLLQITLALLLGGILVNYIRLDYDYLLHTPLLKVAMISVVLLLFFGLRSFLGYLARYAFGISMDYNQALKVSNYYRIYAVGLLWVGVLLYYHSTISPLIILIILGIILLVFRGIQYVYNLKKQPESQRSVLYYNILYLCTLEILPVLVLFKFLTMW